MTDPVGVIGQDNFGMCFHLLLKCFYLANLPCSHKKLKAMEKMQGRIVEFVCQVAQNQPWADYLQQNVLSFESELYSSIVKLGEHKDPLEFSKQDLLRQTSK